MGKPLRVLIVEDSDDDAQLLLRELRRSGFDPTAAQVDTPQGMMTALDRQGWDIVICDYAMPNFSAPAALTLLKEMGIDLPFIIVSGSIGEEIAVEMMKAGAHDYMMKGNLNRLVPAVERELRELEVRRQRKRSEEALRAAEARFRGLLESAPDAIVVTRADGRIAMVNGQAERIFGHARDELVGRPIETLLTERIEEPDVGREESGEAGPSAGRPGHSNQIEGSLAFWGRRRDGSAFPAEVSVSPMQTEEDLLIMSIIRDVTERKRAEETIHRLAYYDPLTGFPNRVLLQERLGEEIRSGRKEQKMVALLLLDLDRFKEINDTLGHHCGDLLLQEVGSRLRSALWTRDLVARLGGDEFAVLMPLAEANDAARVAEKVLKTLELPFVIDALPVVVEGSIGIAICPDHGETAEALIRRAEVAMYGAKRGGSGWALYDPKYDRHSPRRLALMGALRQAIEGDQLLLHYQPKVDLKTRRVVGVEALVRWQHPEYGFIPPDQFIGPAEQTGLIRPLTLWVFGAAQRQCAHCRRTGREMDMAMNISARNLHDLRLPDQIAELLQACDVPPGRFEMEITESAIMADPSRALEALTRLRGMGIRFSIDDFGTGYSSLAYLQKLPIDAIKIDKSFTMNMATSKDDAVIVKSTIDLAHDLGLQVVAEGVENQETLDRLTSLGCDAAQGYHISRPLPPAEMLRWLAESPWGAGTAAEQE